MTRTAIDTLAEVGCSTWLDDLSRDRLDSGNLAELTTTKSIVGVTTNPAIFSAAMLHGTAYDEQIAELKTAGIPADRAVYEMAIADVQRACDVLRPIYDRTDWADGRVSIEVDPRISADRDATIAQARQLWAAVDRPNAMIKIPATPESLPAVADALAEGICVNVTLIFSLAQYREVVATYIEGITRAAEAGLDVSAIHSVASVFVSRLDTEVDKRLEAIGTEEALALRGKAGIANSILAYEAFEDLFAAADLPAGANVQRPLWASTGVKNPDYPADMYVTELAAPNTVNTMPEKTIDAAIELNQVHGNVMGDQAYAAAHEVMAQLHGLGIDFADVFALLDREGVEKFVASTLR